METLKKGNDFIFDCVHLVHYKCHKINNKKCQRITKIKPLDKPIDKYNWEGINYPSEKDDWKKSKKNNVMIALSVFCGKKEKKSILLMFQIITQIMKNKLFV